MSRIPISIQKMKKCSTSYHRNSESTSYLFSISEKNQIWEKTIICSYDELKKLRDMIENVIKETTTAEILNIPPEKASIIDKYHETDDLCKECHHKMTYKCIQCLLILQSPLERLLFLELLKNHIRFDIQYALDWQGQNISIIGKSFNDEKKQFQECTHNRGFLY